jgi:hypothetical protein
MSLNSTITKIVEEYIQNFISKVSEKYNIDETDLFSLFNNKSDSVSKPKLESKHDSGSKSESKYDSEIKKDFIITNEMLLKANKEELKAMCKTKGYKCTGTKDILINRLLGKDDNPSPKSKNTVVAAKKPAATKSTNLHIVKIPELLIKRNKWNNFVHEETQLVFDNDSKSVIGKQNTDGTIEELNIELIDICNAFKFKYKLPNNLDNKKSLVDVKVAELEESEEESEDIEIEEDLEEEDVEDLEDVEDELEEDLEDELEED